MLANTPTSYESSDEVKFPVPARVKHKAITAGVVGGILFFIVAIILSICAVKICNKRKRRKQEKGEYFDFPNKKPRSRCIFTKVHAKWYNQTSYY